ncbi:unnamed protein product, partial [Angiostrongylus costaricensis]|uniref:Secreted protein n=1 Tax=Angiostrongylus costaricensis TaxID=334426 RepID=A0A0R3PAU0_ANGCS
FSFIAFLVIFPLQYNGLVGPEFYSPFTIKAPRFPPNAVIGLSRPLQRGLRPPQVHYVFIKYGSPRIFAAYRKDGYHRMSNALEFLCY